MKTENILYTQNSIRNTFHDRQSIYGYNSHINQPLRVTKYDGKYWTLENRTLYSKEVCNKRKKTQIIFVPFGQCKDEFWRKRTGNGDYPKVRG